MAKVCVIIDCWSTAIPRGGIRAAHDQGVFPPGEAVVHLDARVVARRLQPLLPASPRRRPPRRRPQAQRGGQELGAQTGSARPQPILTELLEIALALEKLGR